MAERTDADILADLGVDAFPKTKAATSPRDARIIAGFEDIQKFVAEHGKVPQHGAEHDIFERLYAGRLDRLRAQPDCLSLLGDIDTQGLLAHAASPDGVVSEEMDDDALLAALGVEAESGSLSDLKHVRSQSERRAADEIAIRQPCADFDQFAAMFSAVQADIADGTRQTRRFERKSEIEQGRFFIVDGLTAYVAEAGEMFLNESGNRDSRLRVIYDNGTESNLLARSLQKALTQDPAGRRITEVGAGPLFDQEPELTGSETGTIYVLRSHSEHPDVAKNREIIHKIGVTGGQIEKRFSNAESDPTFLMASVEVVATFRLIDIDRTALENLLHCFFATGRLDVTIYDRFGKPVHPREWFLVPLQAIHECITKIQDRTLHLFEYNGDQAAIIRRQ